MFLKDRMINRIGQVYSFRLADWSKHTISTLKFSLFYMFKTNLYNTLLYKMGKDFLDMQYCVSRK